MLAITSPMSLAMCPMNGQPPSGHPRVFYRSQASSSVAPAEYISALRTLDVNAVKDDLKNFFRSSDSSWPSDYNNYAPFMVRLLWHNTGSYRQSDGRGGVDGARQRFDPERSWEDNTNLDKARDLLEPIKIKYGNSLSWGDLIVLAGNTAVESMGGPILGTCLGRIDDADGSWSEALGPSDIQEELAPCKVNGTCVTPLGSTTVGLIYLNPEGPLGQPLPEKSAYDVRDAFARMAMNDTETVALIGGGHSFGKTHGACPEGHGPSPKEDPANPWPGKCGDGKGANAFTSGFEGPWTTNPTTWDNGYFKNLVSHDWVVHKGPGGHYQWKVNGTSPSAPGPQGGEQDIMMLTSDISLSKDPLYRPIIEDWATDDGAKRFDHAWSHAWYKLVTRDMGPITRCVGPLTPPAQPFQFPLPDPTPASKRANISDVRIALSELDTKGFNFATLAWQCASSFRVTDYQGGCNGARIRFAPANTWPANKGLDTAISLLAPVKARFGDSLSWADLIVLAGSTLAIDPLAKNMPSVSFCDGRSDDTDGSGWAALRQSSSMLSAATTSATRMTEFYTVLGLTAREMVALVGGAYMVDFHHVYPNPLSASNIFFTDLLTQKWTLVGDENQPCDSGLFGSRWNSTCHRYTATASDGRPLYMFKSDLLIKSDAPMRAIADMFASDAETFSAEFQAAWTKVMNSDRFDGPVRNLCEAKGDEVPQSRVMLA
uniref:Plant heme peroxidase family profile domain-containing protein n=1 Tax=Coccolithus braarudii TaxID=221442 RepID=A0A7S0LRE2_9EUKA